MFQLHEVHKISHKCLPIRQRLPVIPMFSVYLISTVFPGHFEHVTRAQPSFNNSPFTSHKDENWISVSTKEFLVVHKTLKYLKNINSQQCYYYDQQLQIRLRNQSLIIERSITNHLKSFRILRIKMIDWHSDPVLLNISCRTSLSFLRWLEVYPYWGFHTPRFRTYQAEETSQYK